MKEPNYCGYMKIIYVHCDEETVRDPRSYKHYGTSS